MISDSEWSCEKQISRVRGEIVLCFAADDPACPENHKDLLRNALPGKAVNGCAVQFEASHGWSFPDRYCFDFTTSENFINWHWIFFHAG